MLDPLVLSMGFEEFGQSRLTVAVIFILIFILSVSRVLGMIIHSFVSGILSVAQICPGGHWVLWGIQLSFLSGDEMIHRRLHVNSGHFS